MACRPLPEAILIWPHFGGDDVRESCLAEAGNGEQDMV
jgi:hypothetical protein